MNRRESSRWGRGILVLASCALLALTAGATAATAGTEGPTAEAAKKKCKKGKKSATAAKKKCKSKKKSGGTTTGPVVTFPGPTTDTTPTSPATLTWNTTADLDLYVWEGNGNGGLGGDGIPNSSFSGDVVGLGPETFTDQISPHTRRFTYGICAAAGTINPTNFTLTVQDQTGANHVFTQNEFNPSGPITSDGDTRIANFSGFTPVEPTDWVCGP